MNESPHTASVEKDDQFITDLLLIADKIFFCFCYWVELIQRKTKLVSKSFEDFCKPNNYESFMRPTTSEKVKKMIFSLDNNKSNGSNIN